MGRMTRRMCVKGLDKDLWYKLKDQSLVEGFFGTANLVQKKQAVKEFMIQWSAATARNADADFLLRMGSPAICSPTRGAKRGAGDITAVAAEEDEEDGPAAAFEDAEYAEDAAVAFTADAD